MGYRVVKMGNFDLTDEDMKRINEEKLALARKEVEDRKLPSFGKEEQPKAEEKKEEPKVEEKKEQPKEEIKKPKKKK